MLLIDRLFALQEIHPFTLLSREERTVVAEVAVVETFRQNQLLCSSGMALNRLIILVEGEFEEGHSPMAGKILGVDSLLFGLPQSQDLRCISNTGVCLSLSKSHFYTMIRELPIFLSAYGREVEADLARGVA